MPYQIAFYNIEIIKELYVNNSRIVMIALTVLSAYDDLKLSLAYINAGELTNSSN